MLRVLLALAVLALLQPDPDVLQQHAREGELALAEGRYADAQKTYETLRQLTSNTGEVHARLGLIYFQQGRFADAIAPLREALRLKPGLPKVDALLAMSLSELGRYDEALPALTNAFSRGEQATGAAADPVLQRMAGLHLQRIYTGLGRDRDAVDVALQLAVDPTNANAAYELAEMARKAGEFDRARERFAQALTHYPAFDHALVGLGRTLIALGRPAEALPHLKAAIATNPESDVAWYQLAQAYRKLGDTAAHESALAEFKRVRLLTAQRSAVPHTKRDITPQALDPTSPK